MNLEKSPQVNPQTVTMESSHESTVMEQLRKAQESGDPTKIHEAMLAADEKYKVRSRITNITDFVPVVGSAKMMQEAVTGRQIGTGKKIEGWRRVVHGVTGTAFLAADLTGVGAVGSVVGKAFLRGAIKGGEKIVLQSAEKRLLQKEGANLAARGDKRIRSAEEIAANKDEMSPRKIA